MLDSRLAFSLAVWSDACDVGTQNSRHSLLAQWPMLFFITVTLSLSTHIFICNLQADAAAQGLYLSRHLNMLRHFVPASVIESINSNAAQAPARKAAGQFVGLIQNTGDWTLEIGPDTLSEVFSAECKIRTTDKVET